jgi:hypothetical protein
MAKSLVGRSPNARAHGGKSFPRGDGKGPGPTKAKAFVGAPTTRSTSGVLNIGKSVLPGNQTSGQKTIKAQPSQVSRPRHRDSAFVSINKPRKFFVNSSTLDTSPGGSKKGYVAATNRVAKALRKRPAVSRPFGM